MILIRLSILVFLGLFIPLILIVGQPTSIAPSIFQINALPQAATFLTIPPDARSGSLGDAGVATSPDMNSQHWNPAKYAFIESKGGITVSYTPWLRKLINNANLVYGAGFYRVDPRQVISTSVRYFSLGQIIFTTRSGTVQGEFNPREMAFDLAYSRVVTDNLSIAIALRYIRSDLLPDSHLTSGATLEPATALAGDLELYHYKDLSLFNQNLKFAFGLNISNIGNKISYTKTEPKEFLPINMRLGGALTMNLGENNSICFITDINKFLVPTSPIYKVDSNGNPVYDNKGKRVIAFGKDPNVSVPLGMIRSFWDATGVLKKNGERSVLLEELLEIVYSFGAEYWYKNKLSLRGGYFLEHKTKGNRKYYTTGIGLQLNYFIIDFNYIVPVWKNSPMKDAFRLILSFQVTGKHT